MTEKTEQKEQSRKEVVLLKNHTHYGRPYKAGDTIKVTESEALWLAKQNIIKG